MAEKEFEIHLEGKLSDDEIEYTKVEGVNLTQAELHELLRDAGDRVKDYKTWLDDDYWGPKGDYKI